MVIVISGYSILISDVSVGVKYFAVHLTVTGVSPCIASKLAPSQLPLRIMTHDYSSRHYMDIQ